MRNLLIWPLLLLFFVFQCAVMGSENVIEWVYTDKKETFTNDIVQYFVKKDNSLNIYTIEVMLKNGNTQEEKYATKNIRNPSKKKHVSPHALSNVEQSSEKQIASSDTVKFPNDRLIDLSADQENIVISNQELFDNFSTDKKKENKNSSQAPLNNYEEIDEEATIDSLNELKQTIFLSEDAENENDTTSDTFQKKKKCQKHITKNKATFFSLVTYTTDNDIIKKGFDLLKEYSPIVTLENISDLRQYKYVHHMFDKFSENNFASKEDELKVSSANADKDQFITNYENFMNDMINEVVTVYLEKKSSPFSKTKNIKKKNNSEKGNSSGLKDEKDQNIVENEDVVEDFANVLLPEEEENTNETKNEARKNKLNKKIKISIDPSFIHLKNNASINSRDVEENDDEEEEEEEDDDEEEEEEEEEEDDDEEEEEEEEEEEDDDEEEEEEEEEEDDDDDDEEEEEENGNGKEEKKKQKTQKIKKVTKVNDKNKMKLKMNLDDIKKKFGSDIFDESTGDNESMIHQANILDNLTEKVKKEEPNRHESLIKEASAEGSGLNEKETEESIVERKKRKLEDFKNYEEKVLREIHQKKDSIQKMIDDDLDKLLKPAQKEYLKLARNTRNKLFHEYQDILKEEISEP